MTNNEYNKSKNTCNVCKESYNFNKPYHDSYNTYSSKNDWYDSIKDETEHLYRSKRGDIYTKKKNSKNYTINPLTNEQVPVYDEEEQELIDRTWEISDEIDELEDWLTIERKRSTVKERQAVRIEIDELEYELAEVERELDDGRNGGWLELREKQKKLAQEKEKKKKAKEKKEQVAKTKEEKRIAKAKKERQKAIDDMPDELKDVMDNLFS